MTYSFSSSLTVAGGRVSVVRLLHMRSILLAFLAVLILTGCRGGGTSPVSPTASRSSKPAEVLRLADDYFASLPKQQTEDKEQIMEDYCRKFFDGFTTPGGRMFGGTDAVQQGYLAGQEYRRANPSKIEETMKGFGYTWVETNGVLTVSFEHCGFRPDKQRSQTWWFSSIGDTQLKLPKDTKTTDSGVHIRVRGFLSPRGQFGHLGGYDHEIFAISISRIGG